MKTNLFCCCAAGATHLRTRLSRALSAARKLFRVAIASLETPTTCPIHSCRRITWTACILSSANASAGDAGFCSKRQACPAMTRTRPRHVPALRMATRLKKRRTRRHPLDASPEQLSFRFPRLRFFRALRRAGISASDPNFDPFHATPPIRTTGSMSAGTSVRAS